MNENVRLGTHTGSVTHRITSGMPHMVNHILKLPAAPVWTHLWWSKVATYRKKVKVKTFKATVTIFSDMCSRNIIQA